MLEFGYELREKQKLVKDYVYSDEFSNLLVDWPTGMGKFTAGLMSIDKAIAEGARAMLISPMKALTSEQIRDIRKMFPNHETAVLTGEVSDIKDFTVEECEKYQIFVLTYEKLSSIFRKKDRQELFFEHLDVGVLVIDEAHMITSENRGARLEMLINTIRHKYPLLHFVYLSATIGDSNRFASWCDAKLIHADRSERPVPLEVSYRIHPKIWQPQEKFDYKFNMLLDVIRAHKNDKILVWCSSRDRAESIAKKLAGLPWSYRKDDIVDKLLEHNVCFHDASLDKDERKRVEDEYRNNADFKIISCTATLSMGVNLPADVVVMFDTTRFLWRTSEEKILEDYEYHQVLGRAGRPRISKYGKAFIFTENDYYQSIKEIIDGSVNISSRIREVINREALDVFMYFGEMESDLVDIFGKSYDPITPDESHDAFNWLTNNGFLKVNGELVEPTFIGKMTSYSMIKPETSLKILATNKEAKNIDFSATSGFMWLFDHLLNVDEFLDTIAVRNNKNDRLAVAIAEKIYHFSDERLAKAFVFVFKKFLRLRGLISHDEESSVRVGHEVRGLVEDMLRYVRAAAMICYNEKEIYTRFSVMVKTGTLDVNACKLSLIDGIGDKRIARLFDAGITSVESFLSCDVMKIAKIMKVSEKVASKFIEAARLIE